MLKEFHCKNCGSDDLKPCENGMYVCRACGRRYTNDTIQKQKAALAALLDEDKQEKLANLRNNLWRTVHAQFIDKESIIVLCNNILSYIQNDSISTFYKLACSGNKKALCDYLNNSTYEEINDCADEVISFCIKILSPEILLSLNNYIKRAYEAVDPKKYGEWMQMLIPEAKKVDDGVYDVTIPRDVFIAYKSEDMDAVTKLTDYLENEEGLTCFVAARNLQHGYISDYDNMLEKAIDNCRAVVFVSTTLSRKLGDARKKELPYIKNKDIQNAPPEYKQHGYKLLPKKYKKARIEYVVEGYSQIKTANDSWINEFFDGFERATLPVEVAVQLNELFDSHTLIQDDLSVTRDDEEKKRWQAEADRTQAENERLKRQLEEKQKVLEAQSLAQRKTANTTNQEQSEYPTLSNYNKKEFDIEGTVLTNYIRKNKKGEVKIPQGVTRIDDFAFSECSGLTSITIPNSVTSIGDWAFSECSGLTSITIPDSVASIGEQAFYDCSRLTSITISNSVTLIGEGAFCGCSGLTSITIPYSVTSIGDDAFRDCSGLTSITVPNSVKSIGKDAFSYCSGLTSITIPNSVKSIGKDAFWGCSGLTSVTLPAKFRFAINKAFKREKKHIHFEFLK